MVRELKKEDMEEGGTGQGCNLRQSPSLSLNLQGAPEWKLHCRDCPAMRQRSWAFIARQQLLAMGGEGTGGTSGSRWVWDYHILYITTSGGHSLILNVDRPDSNLPQSLGPFMQISPWSQAGVCPSSLKHLCKSGAKSDISLSIFNENPSTM